MERRPTIRELVMPYQLREMPPSYAEAVGVVPRDTYVSVETTPEVTTPVPVVHVVEALPGPLCRGQSEMVFFRSIVSEQETPGAMVVRFLPWKQSSVQVVCPHCRRSILTQTQNYAERATWLLARAINWMLGCIAWRFKIFPDVAHYCPFCKSHLGTYFHKDYKSNQ